MDNKVRNTPDKWMEKLEFSLYKDLLPCITEPGKLYTEKELETIIAQVVGKEEEGC